MTKNLSHTLVCVRYGAVCSVHMRVGPAIGEAAAAHGRRRGRARVLSVHGTGAPPGGEIHNLVKATNARENFQQQLHWQYHFEYERVKIAPITCKVK